MAGIHSDTSVHRIVSGEAPEVGLEVIEVNIEINDVYVPGPAKPAAAAEARPVRDAIQ